jgi:hypothetical protein
MARFYGIIDGQARTAATRVGSKTSGIRAQAQGWNVGVTVYGDVNEDGEDEFRIYENGGSTPSRNKRLIGTVRADGSFDLATSY